jgi:hypothetical protein
MMEYLTYDEYTDLGGKLDLTAFNRNISRVFGIIENATHGRIKPLYGVPKEVKILCRDLVEFFAECERTPSMAQSISQNAGGVSESITYTDDSDIKNKINSMIYDYLYSVTTKDGTSILYRGARY